MDDLPEGGGSTLSNASPRDQAESAELPVVDEGWYQIDSELARGGLGRILRANDRRMGRVVALKTPLAGDRASRRRLLREAVLTGRLQHPAIVPVYEAGRFVNGEPFYAMKWVSGRSLREVIAQARTLSERLALLPHVIAVADAVAYAHSHHIIHRDIKPSNIVVGAYGETVLLDWGLAKDLAERAPDQAVPAGSPGETAEGAVLGTPSYMAPEQAVTPSVDERADVYALGALLYETLSGRPPYSGAVAEILAQLAAGPPPPLSARQAGVPSDLAAVVDKAMARDPARRYAAAGELAADLRRFATGQLVSSHQYSPAALLRRWVTRYRVVLSAASLALLTIVVVATVSFRRTAGARHLAEQRRDQLVLAQARVALEKDPTETVAWLKTYPPRAADWKTAGALLEDALRLGVSRHLFTGANMACLSPSGELLAIASTESALDLCETGSGRCRRLPSPEGPLYDVAFSPDGRLAATVAENGVLRLFSTGSGESSKLAAGTETVRAFALAFAPDGKSLAVVSRRRILLFDPANPAARPRELADPGLGPVQQLRFSPDGKLLAVSSFENRGVRVWDLASGGSRVFGDQVPAGAELVFTPGGESLIAGNGVDRSIDEWRLATGAHRSYRGHQGIVLTLALSADGETLISGDETGEVRRWDRKSGESRLLVRHGGSLTAVDLWKDAWVASASEDGSVYLTSLGTGDQTLLLGHKNDALLVTISGDGRRAMSLGADRTVRVWEIGEPKRRVARAPGAIFSAPAFSPDGRQLAWACADDRVRLCDAQAGACRTLDGVVRQTSSLAFSGDGKYLLAGGKELRVWDLAQGTSRVLRTGEEAPPMVIFSPDSRFIAAAAGYTKETRVWETDGWRQHLSIPEKMFVSTIAFSPDSRRLASGGDDSVVQLSDLDGRRRLVLHGAEHANHSLCFSPDGATLAAANNNGEVLLWNSDSGAARTLPGRHEAPAVAVAFSPDGAHLASASFDHMVRLWDLRTSRVRVLRGHRGIINAIRFSPDGSLLASAAADGTIRLWAVASDEYRVLRAHDKSVSGIAFSPDGRLLSSTSQDATVQVWFVSPFAPPQSPERLLGRASEATTAQLNDRDQPATSP